MALAGYLPPIVAQIVADTKGLSAGIGEAKKELTGLQAGFAKFASFGKMAFAGVAAAAVAVGYESVKLAMNFDQAMELIHTQAGASQTEVDDLKNKVLALAPAVGIGPEKLAEGLYHIESTGLRGSAAMDVLTQAAKLAQIGMADLDTVTYAMSGVMSVGMKDVHSAADAISFMNATVGMGDMRMGQLAAAIGTGILPSMKSAGLGMTDFSAAIATLADNSVPADEAATRLRMTIAMMSAPSGKAADALASIGIKQTQLADDMRKPNGLLLAVEDLKTHLESAGLTASQQNAVIEHAFGGGRTSGAILTLIEESDKLKSKYQQLGTAAERTKVTDEAWAAQSKQLAQQWDNLKAKIQALAIQLGNFLIPKIEETIGWMQRNKALVEGLAIALGVVLVVAMGAAVVAFVAANAMAVAIGAVLAGLTLIVIGLAGHWGTAWAAIKALFITPFVDTIKFLAALWTGNWSAMGNAIKDAWNNSIKPIINAIAGGISGVIDLMNQVTGSDTSGAAISAPRTLGHAGGGHSAVGINRASQGVIFRGAGHLNSYGAGGVVDGPIGAPQMAIVHGGETITPAGGGGGDIVIHQRIVTADGKTVREQTLRYARRAGLKANGVYANAAVYGNLTRA